MFFAPVSSFRGEVTPPADKSISHRAAIVAAMGSTPVRIRNYLKAADTHATLQAVQRLGAQVTEDGADILITGVGIRGARDLHDPIDVANAGTLLRLLPGWLAGQSGREWTLDGDESIRRRPVQRIVEPLVRMGAELEDRDGCPPLRVRGNDLKGIEYQLPVASAQVKSCVLFAGLLAEGETVIEEPTPTRDHTERILVRAGVDVSRNRRTVSVQPTEEIHLESIDIPCDPSSAAFHAAAATLISTSRIHLQTVGVNRTRTGFFRVLSRMGGAVQGEFEAAGDQLGAHEPISDLQVQSASLAGVAVESLEVPAVIDELPLIALLGCFAEGETVVRGAGELRFKESNRLEGLVNALRDLGGKAEVVEDGFVITPTGGLPGGVLHSQGDHRLAMMGAVAGLASTNGVEVVGMEAADVSYPHFLQDLQTLASH